MTAIITIFEIEFAGKEEVSRKVEQLSSDVKKIEGACIYSPRSGKLMEFLTILRENKISYGTHFNTLEGSL